MSVLSDIVRFLYEAVGPTVFIFLALAVEIFGRCGDVWARRLRGVPLDDAVGTGQLLGRLSGLAQLTGLVGTCGAMIQVMRSLQFSGDMSVALTSGGHVLRATAVGLVLSMVAETTLAYALREERA